MRARYTMLFLSLLWAGCTLFKKAPDEEGYTGPGDQDSEADTDTDADADSDTDADTDSDSDVDNYQHPEDFDIYEGPASGRINGVVVDQDGQPLAGVPVRLSTGEEQSTDDNGAFLFSELTPTSEPDDELERYHVSFGGDGHTTAQRLVLIEDWETRSLHVTLMETGSTVAFDAELGGSFEEGPLQVEIPPQAFVDGEGDVVTGEIQLSMTAPDVGVTGTAGAPGDFWGVTADGETMGLASFGFFELVAEQDGEELNLAEGVTVPTSYTMSEHLPETQMELLGDQMDFWWWNPDEAIWEYESTADVVTDAKGVRTMSVDLPHFSSWNYDYAYESTCVEFTVLDPLGNPIEGANLTMEGLTYAISHYVGAESGSTDEDGKVTLWGLPNAESHVTGTVTVEGEEFTEEMKPVVLYDAVDMDIDQCPYQATMVIPVCIVGGDIQTMLIEFWMENPDGSIESWRQPWGETIFYWPSGNFELCHAEWSQMQMDSCEYFGADEVFEGSDDQDGTIIGAGDIVRMSDGAVALDFTPVAGEEGYETQYEPVMSGILGELVQGPALYGLRVQGESLGVPGFDEQESVYLPPKPEGPHFSNTPAHIDTSTGLPLEINTEYDENGIFIYFWTTDDNGDQVQVMCRLSDEGELEVPAEAMSWLPGGRSAQMSVFRASFDYIRMPTGYVLRSTTMQMAQQEVELQ